MLRPLTIISGMGPIKTGMGNLISQLIIDKKKLKTERLLHCKIIWGSYGSPLKEHLIRKEMYRASKELFYLLRSFLIFNLGCIFTLTDQNVLLIHPQTLGFQWCLNFIKKSKRPVWLFLADSSFFCVRSYNYIPGEKTACTRCLGGNFDNVETNKCKPFPVNDKYTLEFIKSIKQLGDNQKVRFIAQNKTQALLARKHFGENAIIEISGLILDDWMENRLNKINHGTSGYDAVFHGHYIEAKGVKWAIDLASNLPNYSFLFPFPQDVVTYEVPSNCFFKDISWNTGLKEEVSNCKLILVPSLWSAPIEGSLIKSLHIGKKVAVIENKTSFSNEIPDRAIIKLPHNILSATEKIKSIMKSEYKISNEETQRFLSNFRADNHPTLQKIFDILF